MVRRWRCRLSLLLSGLLSLGFASAENSFENTAIVRTVELGGSLVQVSTTYAVKALEDDARLYKLALGKREHERTSWLEARIKGQAATLPLEDAGYDPESGIYFYSVELPTPLKMNETANVVVDTVETHATYPWPEQASQKDGQSLKSERELFVLSPYATAVERIKFRSPSPTVHSYTDPGNMDEFTMEAPVTKSGATITYGPYHNVPVTASKEFLQNKQKTVAVHYSYESPVLEVTEYHRAAEISHWGANLNIEDKISLHNAGPSLKGHFSRLEYQASNFYGRPPPHIIPGLSLQLPAGIHSAYYYDLIGNVSTSRLRTALSPIKGMQSNQFSLLELRPRYPLMGGWNYSFTLGWDSPLEDYAGYDQTTGNYVVAIPLMTVFPGAVVDEAEIKIIMPEGATDVDFFPPLSPIESYVVTHVTYLDTVGRPAVVLKYRQLTPRHAGTIYVTYKVPLSAHLKKPMAVAAAFMGLFVLGFVIKRMDIRIQKK
ncbi:oligosaccharyl transferase alpha subunit [Laetiporus sulphureus 93-53]|uniref:Dolichyl-diphosphooligosaccharide--protein glycosyltransferase subunit 1 n=1 Tax=Laetiporus sulphureus 93-53 TaxID=1314785 RepID=A0A165I401_9APHY|nr:oligosaccharyl transferase alpha subunit [Laetiporus sulphureus 93-53]KZT12566.1 oligosaccharyl transferase alpha subunit [Laetiporus sulphureus 93-53]